ncbi:hypothetical protein R75465_08070 [Paraburkholderia aspalathi]|jgi:hypothetical protein|uniref:hypothetical protein n=1 Tax=Paraburkholderia aspalathi TaxID=1324617 RepID=UPI001B13F894|nr:hypothetical protein [Paraburkholderia aspalathi]CAE6867643.1 hypothetical protein R75465_08070 [Paraburkholderia aspalathi]
MGTGEKSLRSLIDKWLGSKDAMTIHVLEFSRMPADRRRYVRVGASQLQGTLAIVFFRHDDGSWNVFPPKSTAPAMRAERLAAQATVDNRR